MAGVAREIPVVTAALAVHDLHVSYAGAGPALRGVSLEVADGGVTAVLGSNGAGKTTLLRALSGTLRSQRGTITRGTIEFAGRNLAGAHAADIARSGLVQVPEGRRVFGTLTVEENLRAGGLAARDKHAATGARRRAVPDPARAPRPSAPRCCPAASSRCSRSAAR